MHPKPAVFLSASVPLPDRHPRYFNTADVIAIRESVLALAQVVSERGVLVFGGHPAITPLIRLALRNAEAVVSERFVLYQSAFFQGEFPEENDEFERVIETAAILGDREGSVRVMREAMLSAYPYDLGVFIGGMEGLEEEFVLFRQMHGQARLMPIASTGAAAKIVFDQGKFPREFEEDFVYRALFKRYLGAE